MRRSAVVLLIAWVMAGVALLATDGTLGSVSAATTGSYPYAEHETITECVATPAGSPDVVVRAGLGVAASAASCGYDDSFNLAGGISRLHRYRVAPNTTRAAAGAAENALPATLRGGPANVHVYQGVSGGKPVYTGITNDLTRRGAQHGSRYELLEAVTTSPVTRGQARAIEEALFVRNLGFQNIRHPISPSHAWYQDALDWGNTWLRSSGF